MDCPMADGVKAFFELNLRRCCREEHKEERYGGNPTSHTPAHNVPAVAAPFRA